SRFATAFILYVMRLRAASRAWWASGEMFALAHFFNPPARFQFSQAKRARAKRRIAARRGQS
ncbi:MAG: hypothetical protein C4346_07985, partial [Chloroflexota bacterium]